MLRVGNDFRVEADVDPGRMTPLSAVSSLLRCGQLFYCIFVMVLTE
jgi:hypothetical protein